MKESHPSRLPHTDPVQQGSPFAPHRAIVVDVDVDELVLVDVEVEVELDELVLLDAVVEVDVDELVVVVEPPGPSIDAKQISLRWPRKR